MNDRILQRSILALPLLVLLNAGGCESESTPVGSGGADTGAPDVAVRPDGNALPSSCAGLGCAAPPPCGQVCTDPCGCCANLNCPVGDAAPEGGDADARDSEADQESVDAASD